MASTRIYEVTVRTPAGEGGFVAGVMLFDR
jgi:hypothetical protein